MIPFPSIPIPRLTTLPLMPGSHAQPSSVPSPSLIAVTIGARDPTRGEEERRGSRAREKNGSCRHPQVHQEDAVTFARRQRATEKFGTLTHPHQSIPAPG